MLAKQVTAALLFSVLSLTVAGQGTQFITGPCANDAACASGCCGFNSGRCAGAVIAQERDGGCGFGNAQPNANAANAFRAGQAGQAAAGGATTLATRNVAITARAPQGTQFITGNCANDAACASGCCGFRSGRCAGPVIAQSRDGGCGFGNAQPNADAARAFGFTGQPGAAA